MSQSARIVVVFAAIVALLGAGILLSIRNAATRPEPSQPDRTVAQTPPAQDSESPPAQGPQDDAAEDTETPPTHSTEPEGEHAEIRQQMNSAPRPEANEPEKQKHEDSTADDSAAQAPAMDEETFIDLSVEIVVTAMGMQNTDTPRKELQKYVRQRLDEEGYSADAFEGATDRILADPQHAKEVSREIVRRVKKQTGLQMDLRVLPMLDPRWEKAGSRPETNTEGEPAQQSH